MNDICLVSALIDIDRKNWKNFQRSVDTYLSFFKPYITHIKHEMVVFIDDQHFDKLKELCQNANHIRLIPINREWLDKNIYAWQWLNKEIEIMNSNQFTNLIKHRLHHPECSKPKYNIAVHSKIDFCAYVINNELTKAKYIAWTDFGHFQLQNRIPKFSTLNINKFDLDKINIQTINPITEKDKDIMYTLVNAPDVIATSFYLGRRDLILKLQTLYHQIMELFYSQNIVDDDQHIMLQCIFSDPSLFKIWNLKYWHIFYLLFQSTQ